MLFEFVKANLNIDAVKKIEKMIDPSIMAHDSDSTMSDKRLFLYEVQAHCCMNNHCVTFFYSGQFYI